MNAPYIYQTYRAPRLKRFRWWLADRLEALALQLGEGVHGLRCDGDCYCHQAGRERWT